VDGNRTRRTRIEKPARGGVIATREEFTRAVLASIATGQETSDQTVTTEGTLGPVSVQAPRRASETPRTFSTNLHRRASMRLYEFLEQDFEAGDRDCSD